MKQPDKVLYLAHNETLAEIYIVHVCVYVLQLSFGFSLFYNLTSCFFLTR